MSKQLLAKLNVKSVNLNPIGGAPDITWQDVAFAVAGLSEESYFYAKAVYCESNYETARLIDLIVDKYKQPKDLITAALFEIVYPNRCYACSGSGEIATKECEKCLGSGLRKFSDRERAAIIGRSRDYYKARKSKYDFLIGYFNELDSQVMLHLRRRFRTTI